MAAGDWFDRRALDNRGRLLGVIVDVYDDPMERRPAWLAISTGFFGVRVAIAPLDAASRLGEDVVIARDRDTVLNAPRVDVVVAVAANQRQQLIDHYALPQPIRREKAGVVVDPITDDDPGLTVRGPREKASE